MKPHKKIIAKIKSLKKPDWNDKITEFLVNKQFRQRDMRQEAMDIGSHGAKEFFGGMNDKGA